MTARTRKSKNGNGAALAEGSPDGFPVKIKAEFLTWEDMYFMTSLRNVPEFTIDMVASIRDLFNRVVEGGAAAVPVLYTRAVMAQLGEAMKEMGNPGN